MGMVRYIPNIITLTRIPLAICLLCLILQREYIAAALIFIAICLTDVLDGAAARALGACSRLGAYMDVAADLLYVLTSLAVLNINGCVPVWFMAVVALKFIEFAVTSRILKRKGGEASVWIFDGLGRCFAALAFISPGVLCLAALLPEVSEYVTYFLLIPACVFAVASSAARAFRCVRYVK
jgi:CDP-diacylglycerol--glycerol-3-phosphate 3-phosphatidyltransferase